MSFGVRATTIDAEAIRIDAESFFRRGSANRRDHASVLQEILNNLEPFDFRKQADLEPDESLPQRVQVVLVIQKVLEKTQELNCGLCRNQDFIYTFNGEYWQLIEKSDLERFLGEAAERLGVPMLVARHYKFKRELLHQFLAEAYLPTPAGNADEILINLLNGTGELTAGGFKLRTFDRKDFLTYQLPFTYDPAAQCPMWQAFLYEVLPDESRQRVLAEFIGYVFARHLKLEKALILFGPGANGKSVVFEVANALLGIPNVSNVSLESLCRDQHYRATLANKLLNFSSEISDRLQADKFKQLASGEPIEARLPYGQPMILTKYARLAFNTNQLPRDVEHNEAFFRRFLIIPFDVTIPAEKRNPLLAKEVIESELSGVFNWVLNGLARLLEQNGFSTCRAAELMLETYRKESDTVAMFMEDEGFRNSTVNWISLKDLYALYRTYCMDNGTRALSSKNFNKRLETLGFESTKLTVGKVFYVEK